MGCCLAPPRHHHPNYCAPVIRPAVIITPGIRRGPGFHHGAMHGGFGILGHRHRC
jgi:hypothetical protein